MQMGAEDTRLLLVAGDLIVYAETLTESTKIKCTKTENKFGTQLSSARPQDT